ncbi:two-component system OmpR family response regulator [Sphingomonas jinjuensis]|uniref:Two-component system OmpR family response regulator n=1 Tax=Sphingomonas jinjuensis TaxID=535907 RepID=A0A840FA15_9SPHN|nr:response regulator transcription factor [Sphingomonas jinjuensis]MBB4154860.1 two-component system OmpR family response regulator [Sphingomonas jinjuensis]
MPVLHVLIVEDDGEAAARLAADLAASGHNVRTAGTLDAAREARAEAVPDVIVLDRMIGGRDALAEIEPSEGRLFPEPVLVLTSMAGLSDRIAGLDAGADDYLIKPADPRELEARLRALVRRPKASSDNEVLTCGILKLDRMLREAWAGDRKLPLQPREFRLLEELAIARGEIVTRRMLLERVWNLKFDPRTKLIETHVSRLRDKLGTGTGMPSVVTERGVGYRLTTP